MILVSVTWLCVSEQNHGSVSSTLRGTGVPFQHRFLRNSGSYRMGLWKWWQLWGNQTRSGSFQTYWKLAFANQKRISKLAKTLWRVQASSSQHSWRLPYLPLTLSFTCLPTGSRCSSGHLFSCHGFSLLKEVTGIFWMHGKRRSSLSPYVANVLSCTGLEKLLSG